MPGSPIFKRILAFSTLFAIILAAYLLVARPYQLRWGATDKELARSMPGDDLDPSPTFLSTRAITIHGTPKKIWPWLLQMGYGRAGFYGYDIMENVGSPRGMDSAYTILPELQKAKVGDPVPLSSVSIVYFYAIEPPEYFIWTGQVDGKPTGAFTWALYPIDEQQTRLVSRIRWTHHSLSQPGPFMLDVFTDLTDHLAVRKILQGVKGRVEGNPEKPAVTNLKFVILVFSFVVFVIMLAANLIFPFTWPRWLGGLAAGIAWLLLWYAPIW